MYPGNHAKPRADQAAFIMALSGEAVTYAALEARTNRLAHFLRSRGLKRLDHYSIFMENNARYIECCGAGERSGLYFTCINSFLTADDWLTLSTTASPRHWFFPRPCARSPSRHCVSARKSRSAWLWTDRATALAFSISMTRHRAFPPRRSRTGRQARRCCIHREPPAGRRALSGPCPNSRRRSNSRCSIFFRSCGVIGKD
jgi:acyl-CoA synthetase (AMP-forming)/AMP-acid ligase II